MDVTATRGIEMARDTKNQIKRWKDMDFSLARCGNFMKYWERVYLDIVSAAGKGMEGSLRTNLEFCMPMGMQGGNHIPHRS